jgi:hypothetical protein
MANTWTQDDIPFIVSQQRNLKLKVLQKREIGNKLEKTFTNNKTQKTSLLTQNFTGNLLFNTRGSN